MHFQPILLDHLWQTEWQFNCDRGEVNAPQELGTSQKMSNINCFMDHIQFAFLIVFLHHRHILNRILAIFEIYTTGEWLWSKIYQKCWIEIDEVFQAFESFQRRPNQNTRERHINKQQRNRWIFCKIGSNWRKKRTMRVHRYSVFQIDTTNLAPNILTLKLRALDTEDESVWCYHLVQTKGLTQN